MDYNIRCEGAHPLYGALSRRGLDPIKLAYMLTTSGVNLMGNWGEGETTLLVVQNLKV